MSKSKRKTKTEVRNAMFAAIEAAIPPAIEHAVQSVDDRIANLTRCNDEQREHIEALQRQNQKQLEELGQWKIERDRLWFGCRNLLGFLCYARKQAMPQSLINSTLMHDLPMLITGTASHISTPRSHGYAKYIDL